MRPATTQSSTAAAWRRRSSRRKVADGGRHVWNQYTVRVTGGRRDALQKYLGRAADRLGDLLSGAAPLAEVLRVAGLPRRQLAGDRTGGPRSAFAARLSGTDRGGARGRHRRDRPLLPGEESAAGDERGLSAVRPDAVGRNDYSLACLDFGRARLGLSATSGPSIDAEDHDEPGEAVGARETGA